MNNFTKTGQHTFTAMLVIIFFLSSCNLQVAYSPAPSTPTQNINVPAFAQTPLPVRRTYRPGELVDYTAQTGDTLPALAARFNTTVNEIFEANPQIPRDATTMPPGMPMKIPIYYLALWASPFQIIPDHAFVNGPTVVGFNTSAYVKSQPGWLKNYRVYAGDKWRSGAEMVDYVAVNYSINPRLLLAILEYQGGALTQPAPPVKKNLLGFTQTYWENPYLQLVIAANTLNNGYYGWRIGNLTEFEDTSNILIRPDPWQNAASVSIQYYYSRIFAGDKYALATGPRGLFQTYESLFATRGMSPLCSFPAVYNNQYFNSHFKVIKHGITQAGLIQAGEPANLWQLWILLPHPIHQAALSQRKNTLPPQWQMASLFAPVLMVWLLTLIKTAMNAQAGSFFTCTLPINNAHRLEQN